MCKISRVAVQTVVIDKKRLNRLVRPVIEGSSRKFVQFICQIGYLSVNVALLYFNLKYLQVM